MLAIHIFSFFSGSGFLDLGFEKSGFVVDSVNEYSPAFTQAYRHDRKVMGIAEPRFGYTRDINVFLTKGDGKQLRKDMKTYRAKAGLWASSAGRRAPIFPLPRNRKAVTEVEHTTGVTSGLTRMKGLYDMIPEFKIRYVIVAPDEDRDMVIEKCNRPQFVCLDARYFSYSSVRRTVSYLHTPQSPWRDSRIS